MLSSDKPERLADEIRRSIAGDPWHGPSLSETLDGITAAQAVWRAASALHNIWELTAHVAIWHKELLAVTAGRAYRTVSELDQWPPIKTPSAPEWKALLEGIQSNNSKLATQVSALTDAQLGRKVVDRDYDLEFLLHGFAQHNAYHTGQIAILKRLLPKS